MSDDKRPPVGSLVSDLRDAVLASQGEQARTGERLAVLEGKIDGLVASQAETREAIKVAAVKEEAAREATVAAIAALRADLERRVTRTEHKDAVRRIESLEGDRAKFAWGIFGSILAALSALGAAIAKLVSGGG